MAEKSLIADDADTMADAVLTLLDDMKNAPSHGKDGQRVRIAYAWRAVGDASRAVYRGTGRGQD